MMTTTEEETTTIGGRTTITTTEEETNDEVESFLAKSVKELRGWETFAGIVERTRRTDLSVHHRVTTV